MTIATDSSPAEALTLAPAEQAVLSAEIAAFAATLGDPGLRDRYAELAAAVETGSVPPSLVGLVEAMAELVLQTQRVRRRHGPEAERALTAVYYRTPRGLSLKQSAAEVNAALAALTGQTLAELSFAPTPGGQRLTIATEQGQLELLIDRAGVRVERVDVGSVL